jgi:hypothetical protein
VAPLKKGDFEKNLVPPFLRGARGDLNLIVKQHSVAGFELKLSPIVSGWERRVRGSTSREEEAEPPEMRSQALPGNEETRKGRGYSETPARAFSCS